MKCNSNFSFKDPGSWGPERISYFSKVTHVKIVKPRLCVCPFTHSSKPMFSLWGKLPFQPRWNMKYNERVRHLETHNALNTLWQQCCPQEIRKQFRKMKWVKRAVTGNKGCRSASKWVTASCAWEFQPLGVGGKPPNKFKRITTECFLWNVEDIYITLSAPLISCTKTEWLSLFSCLKRVIFHHI